MPDPRREYQAEIVCQPGTTQWPRTANMASDSIETCCFETIYVEGVNLRSPQIDSVLGNDIAMMAEFWQVNFCTYHLCLVHF